MRVLACGGGGGVGAMVVVVVNVNFSFDAAVTLSQNFMNLRMNGFCTAITTYPALVGFVSSGEY